MIAGKASAPSAGGVCRDGEAAPVVEYSPGLGAWLWAGNIDDHSQTLPTHETIKWLVNHLMRAVSHL